MIRASVVFLAAFTALTGLAYPLAMTGLAQVLFPVQANGGRLGAVGQLFTKPELFHGRPSATTPPYNAEASTGSNQSPTNPAFLDAVRQRVEALRAENPDQPGLVPADLVTASGSGLDPDVSVMAAVWQIPRVAKARGLSQERLLALVEQETQGRFLGLFGERHVNVVGLNLALEALASGPSTVANPTQVR
jgi:potassium-transporting ATPase KdpC subunit